MEWLWTHPVEVALALALLWIAGIWFALRGAPLVDESRCPHRDRLPGGECGGPCRQGRLPCEVEA